MKARHCSSPVVVVLLIAASAMARAEDIAGAKDPALFTRMPNFSIKEYWETQFDGADFSVQKGTETATTRVEGHFVKLHYIFDDAREATQPSPLQILRNYRAAALKAGGQILYEHDPESLTARFTKGGKEVWAAYAGGSSSEYFLTIVEKQAMQQDVTASAEALQGGLAERGHAEVPGIFFDFGQSEVKPGSEAAIDAVARLLQANPGLRVWIVGHTDSVGSADSNVKLSNARAAAVVKVLTQKMGVSAARLAPFGAGPYAPRASNATEDGRAQNRRVELVAQP